MEQTKDSYLTIEGNAEAIFKEKSSKFLCYAFHVESEEEIAAHLERLRKQYPACQVVLHDERFTSVIAHRAMIDGGMKKMARRDKAVVDKISATIILQSFMESLEYKQISNNF